MIKKRYIILSFLLLETVVFLLAWNSANNDRAFHESEGFGGLAWLAFYKVVPLAILGLIFLLVVAGQFIVIKPYRPALWWSLLACILYMPVLVVGWNYSLKARRDLWEKHRDKVMLETDGAWRDSMLAIGRQAGFRNVHWDTIQGKAKGETASGERFCYSVGYDSSVEIYKDIVERRPPKDSAYWFGFALHPAVDFMTPAAGQKLDSMVKKNDYRAFNEATIDIGAKQEIIYLQMPRKNDDRVRIVVVRGMSRFRAPDLSAFEDRIGDAPDRWGE